MNTNYDSSWALPVWKQISNRILFSKILPPVLYHYTNAAGLFGICRESEMWATDLRYVNDSMELLEAARIFIDSIKENQNSFQAEVRDIVQWFEEDLLTKDSNSVYAVSFTKKGDDLGQWRGYCANGKGYSIGFDATQISMLPSGQWRIYPCIYDPVEQSALMDIAVKKGIEYADSQITTGIPIETIQMNLYLGLILTFWSFAPYFKNSAFKDEEEWRLACRPSNDSSVIVKYRERDNSIVPYITLPLILSSSVLWKIKEIVVGPTHHPKLGLQATQSFAASQKQIVIETVSSSRVPYQII